MFKMVKINCLSFAEATQLQIGMPNPGCQITHRLIRRDVLKGSPSKQLYGSLTFFTGLYVLSFTKLYACLRAIFTRSGSIFESYLVKMYS